LPVAKFVGQVPCAPDILTNQVSQTITRQGLMEKKTGFLEISSSAWVVIGILALVMGGAIIIWGLLFLAFGITIG